MTTTASAHDLVRPAAVRVKVRLFPRRFWRIQIVGWLVAAMAYYLAVLPTADSSALELAGMKLGWAVSGLGVSTLLARVYALLRLEQRGIGHTALAAGLLSSVTGVGWLLGLGAVARVMGHNTHMLYTATSFPFVASNFVLMMLAWSGAYLSLVFWLRSRDEEQKSLAALSLAREAQLEMLRYQLNPHFLFNAMTSVRALILEHPDRARELVTRLSDFLRYTLGARQAKMVTVADEIRTARDYLAIEEVRFEERLGVEVVVDPRAADERVPGFLLHPLIENAIKHGAPLDGRLSVRVEAARRAGDLFLEVANTGRLTRLGRADDGIGLRNVRDRLETIYPGRHEFGIRQDGDLVRTTIVLFLSSYPDSNAATRADH